MTRSELLEKSLDKYSAWYNIERFEEGPLVATAAFHEEGTGYVLFQKAKMYDANRNEYAYFFSVPHLDVATYEKCFEQAQKLSSELIQPDGKHMCSYVVVIFLCDTADQAALDKVKKCRIRKYFQFSLKGWMEVHTAATVIEDDSVVGNPAGHATVEFLKNMLHPKVKRKSLFRK